MTVASPSWFDVIDGTWPAAKRSRHGIWTFRNNPGGGSRVRATTLARPVENITVHDIRDAEARMRAMHQPCLFMVRVGETALDAALEGRGYAIKDPVNVYTCPSAQLMDQLVPRVTVFTVWEPLAIMREIWAAGGIGDARLAIMQRAAGPKTGFLCRHNDKPAGVAFAAIHQGVAMVHAVEIDPAHRRDGMGRWVMRAAAFWASAQGAETLSVMCTERNGPANALYASLGMSHVGQYHYRHLPDGA